MDKKRPANLSDSGAAAPKRFFYWACFAVLLCSYFWIAWRVPYTHDDWDWGLPVGLERWLTGELNNRYVGTFFVLVMTRFPWIKTLILGGGIFLVPHLAVGLVCVDPNRRLSMELLAHGLMLSIPIMTWRQTYGWVSAFANYVVGAVWMLLILTLLKKTFSGQRKWAVLLFPLSLTGQLFVENLSVFMVILTAGAAGYAVKCRRGRAGALAALAGALTGLVLMFYNPLYSDLVHTGTAVAGLRNLVFPVGAGMGEIVLSIVECGFKIILPGLIDAHPVLWGAVILACLIRGAMRKLPWFVLAPAGIFSAAYLCLTLHNVWQQVEGGPVYPESWLRTIGASVLLALIIAALWTDREVRWPGLLFLGAALVLVAPFSAISGYGPRCCYPSLACLLLLALLLVRDIPLSLWHKIGIGLFCLGVLLYHLYVYSVIGRCEALRASLLREAVEQGAQSVTMPMESASTYYMRNLCPATAERAGYFRQFYGLPEDLQLVFLPRGSYDTWPDVDQDMLDRAIIYD